MTKIKNKKGAALVSILGITAITLLIITSTILVSVLNSRIGLDWRQSTQALQKTQALRDEAILRFLRQRSFPNPYPNWTADCLQISDWECKMELDLAADGGLIDIWGKVGNKIRHLQVELDVLEDESVTVSASREIY